VRGVVFPREFIPVAEELGLMSELGAHVLRRACLAARGWHEAFPGRRDVAVSVNLSPPELADPALAETVARTLFEARLPAESLMLEITETDAMSDLDSAHKRMAELRELGVKLVLDDFGTGHSSLERLDSFPLDAVKIAKPFVDRLLDPNCDVSFIGTFVRLARSLRLECIAEGVEHAAQVPLLLERGCTLGQGFHFSEPLGEAELHAYLRAPLQDVG
jgi:EAL domain-containing protein (putative c-di-GMP-specific phosphodiesterase class I)